MEFNHHGMDGIQVLILDGRLDSEAAVELKQRVKKMVRNGPASLVLDMTAVSYVDSAGLGVLVACLRTVTAKEGDLKLSGLSPQLKSVFELTRLHGLFEIYPTSAEAVRSFEAD